MHITNVNLGINVSNFNNGDVFFYDMATLYFEASNEDDFNSRHPES